MIGPAVDRDKGSRSVVGVRSAAKPRAAGGALGGEVDGQEIVHLSPVSQRDDLAGDGLPVRAPSAVDGGVDLCAGGFAIEVTGVCPGQMGATALNAEPGDFIAIIYGFEDGQTEPVPGCPGLMADISNPRVAGKGRADDQGEFSISGKVRAAACGQVVIQAINVTGCAKSEVVGL